MTPPGQWQPGMTVSLAVDAFDPEGEPIAFAWSVDGGRIGYAGDIATSWSLPVEPGAYHIAVAIIDGSDRFTRVTQTLTIHRDGTLTLAPKPLVEDEKTATNTLVDAGPATRRPDAWDRLSIQNERMYDRLTWQFGANT